MNDRLLYVLLTVVCLLVVVFFFTGNLLLSTIYAVIFALGVLWLV